MHARLFRGKVHHACWLLSAISGILAGGILGFGTADRFLFLHLRFDLAVVWLCCFALCKIIPNSSAHKLSANGTFSLRGTTLREQLLGRPQLVGLVLAACPTAKNGVAVTRDYEASAS